jgi:N-acetylglucosaminyl-diphospho-decaprenol L-rhamnosyltransferase
VPVPVYGWGEVSMDSKPAHAVDVVVVSYNSSDCLRSCVAPIAAAGHNVIVVDNASTDGAPDSVRNLPLTLVELDANHGFGYACNRGWQLGSAPYVLFLNPDSMLRSGALEALIAVLDADERVGIAGPRIVGSDGSLTRSQFRFPRIRSTVSEAFYLHRLLPRSAWSSETVCELALYDRARDSEWLSGACLLVRRFLLEAIGGFDESFFLYSEDTELCRAAWSHGYAVRYEPRAVVEHAGGGSAPRAAMLPVMTRSRRLFAAKSYSRPVALGFRGALALEATTHAIVGSGGWATRKGYARSVWAATFEAEETRQPNAG